MIAGLCHAQVYEHRGPDVVELDGVRILALVSLEKEQHIRRMLAPLGANIDFIHRTNELSPPALNQNPYAVALLPAALPDNDWWSLWGEVALLNPRPEILVYTQTASFQMWTGVLELGGYDVIVEPLMDEELRSAVLRAAKSFHDRCRDEESDL